MIDNELGDNDNKSLYRSVRTSKKTPTKREFFTSNIKLVFI